MNDSLISSEDDLDAPRVRRSVLLGAAGAAVAFGAAAAFLVGGGSDQPAEQLVPLSAVVRAPQAQAAAAPPVGHDAGTALKVPSQNTDDIARNPFKARYVEPPPPPPPTAPSAPPVASAPLGTPLVPLPQPVALPLPPRDPDAAPRPPVVEEPEAVEYPITLESVGEPRGDVRLVRWSIDGKKVETVPGQRFGRYGELVVLAYTTTQGGQEVTGVLLQVGDAAPIAVALEETVQVL